MQVEIPEIKQVRLLGEAADHYRSKNQKSEDINAELLCCIECSTDRAVAVLCMRCEKVVCAWCATYPEVATQHCRACSSSQSDSEATITEIEQRNKKEICLIYQVVL